MEPPCCDQNRNWRPRTGRLSSTQCRAGAQATAATIRPPKPGHFRDLLLETPRDARFSATRTQHELVRTMDKEYDAFVSFVLQLRKFPLLSQVFLRVCLSTRLM